MSMEVRDLAHARQIAFSAGYDAANRQMRKHCRKAWSEEDYNLACRTTNSLFVRFARTFGEHELADAIERP